MLRRELSHRPLLAAAFVLAAGLAFRHFPWLVLSAIPVLWIAPSLGSRVGFLGLLLFGMFRAPAPVESVADLTFVSTSCVVATVPRVTQRGEAAVVDCAGRRYVTYWESGRGFTFGDRLAAVGVAHPLREGTESNWLRKGVEGRLDLREAVRTDGCWTLLRWGQMWRDSFREFSASHFSESSRRLVDALCFNVEAGLDDELSENLRRTGTVHIISASGLHVGIFALFLQGVLIRMPISRPLQIAILLTVLVAYVGAAGMRPPVVRAVVMAAVLLNAYRVRREGDLLSALGFASSLQLLIDRWAVFDIGLHLSFVAVLGLGLFVRFDRPESRAILAHFRVRSLQVAHASLVAGLATAPIVAYHFGIVSVVSVLANLLVTPLVGVIVPLALAGWATSWIPAVASTLILPAEFGARILEWIVDGLGGLPIAAVNVPTFHALWIPVFYVALLGLWRERVRPA